MPPHVDEGITEVVLSLLPWAATLRCAISCWMYGNSQIIPFALSSIYDIGSSKGVKGTAIYADFVAKNQGKNMAYVQLTQRIVRANVFPIFFLFVLILVIKLIRKLWTILPIYWVLKITNCIRRILLSVFCGSKAAEAMKDEETGKINGWDLLQLDNPLRQESAPYTGEYFHYLKNKNEIPNTCLKMCATLGDDPTFIPEAEREDGWVATEMGDAYIVKKKVSEILLTHILNPN